MTIDDYFHQIEIVIGTSPLVHISTVTYDKRSAYVGFLRGTLFFLGGSRLHIREFVNVEHAVVRYMYVYHYQTADSTLVFRYDNTPHHPDIASFPHHKHVGAENQIQATPAPDLTLALNVVHKYCTGQSDGGIETCPTASRTYGFHSDFVGHATSVTVIGRSTIILTNTVVHKYLLNNQAE